MVEKKNGVTNNIGIASGSKESWINVMKECFHSLAFHIPLYYISKVYYSAQLVMPTMYEVNPEAGVEDGDKNTQTLLRHCILHPSLI